MKEDFKTQIEPESAENVADTVAPPAKNSAKRTVEDEVNRLHNEIVESDGANLSKALKIGEALQAKREELKKEKHWEGWTKEKLAFDRRTANNYIAVFEAHGKGKLKEVKSLSEAYRAIGILGLETKTKVPPGKYSIGTLTPDKLRETITAVLGKHESFASISVNEKTLSKIKSAIREALKKQGKKLETTGAVIVVPPWAKK